MRPDILLALSVAIATLVTGISIVMALLMNARHRNFKQEIGLEILDKKGAIHFD